MSSETPAAIPSAEHLQHLSATLAEITSNPAFLEILEEIAQAPESERTAAATRLATVEELSARGIPISKDLRITTRYFENPEGVKSGDVVAVSTPSPDEERSSGSGWTICTTTGSAIGGTTGCVSVGKAV
nr:hypothetical protein StreXyl84_77380 [Streptomyces sp. Xyl84]